MFPKKPRMAGFLFASKNPDIVAATSGLAEVFLFTSFLPGLY